MHNEGESGYDPDARNKVFFAVTQLTHLALFVQKCANYAKCVMPIFYNVPILPEEERGGLGTKVPRTERRRGFGK